MITWSLEVLLRNALAPDTMSTRKRALKIPVHFNQIDIFGTSKVSGPSTDSYCMLNINQFITKNYFSRYQHSFFYSDEKITDQTLYIASNFPSMILGTNYGRIFLV